MRQTYHPQHEGKLFFSDVPVFFILDAGLFHHSVSLVDVPAGVTQEERTPQLFLRLPYAVFYRITQMVTYVSSSGQCLLHCHILNLPGEAT